MTTNVIWRGSRSSGQVVGGRPVMDCDDDDGEHIQEEATDGGEATDEGGASGSGRRSRRRSHAVMPPLVPDSEDGKTVIRPTGDG
jgi:hypothetical protein